MHLLIINAQKFLEIIYLIQIISRINFTPKPKSDSRSLAAAFTASYSSQLQLMKTILYR